MEIELLHHKIPLKTSNDFILFLDNFTRILRLNLEESIKLKEGKDILRYKSAKKKSKR